MTTTVRWCSAAHVITGYTPSVRIWQVIYSSIFFLSFDFWLIFRLSLKNSPSRGSKKGFPLCLSFPDELYEILSSLPESVVYSCRPCSVTQPSAWRELLYIELRAGVEKVLACLLSSTLTQHLVTCSQVGDSIMWMQPCAIFYRCLWHKRSLYCGFGFWCSVKSWLILTVGLKAGRPVTSELLAKSLIKAFIHHWYVFKKNCLLLNLRGLGFCQNSTVITFLYLYTISKWLKLIFCMKLALCLSLGEHCKQANSL